MESMKAMSTNDECCMERGNMEGVCHKPISNCADTKDDCAKDEDCSQARTETTCVCICTFQFVAPEQSLIKFDNNQFSLISIYGGLLDKVWIDPYLSAPWQPPDHS